MGFTKVFSPEANKDLFVLYIYFRSVWMESGFVFLWVFCIVLQGPVLLENI